MASVPQPRLEARPAQERQAQSRIIAAAAGARRSLMGLLVSIVAYLSVVAAIVVGFLLSADALLHHSHRLAADQRQEIITAAKTDSLKTKKAVKPARNNAEQRTIPQRSTSAEYRRKTRLSNTRSHEPHEREARRGSWPLYRQADPAPRALGYADEPRFSGDPWRY